MTSLIVWIRTSCLAAFTSIVLAGCLTQEVGDTSEVPADVADDSGTSTGTGSSGGSSGGGSSGGGSSGGGSSGGGSSGGGSSGGGSSGGGSSGGGSSGGGSSGGGSGGGGTAENQAPTISGQPSSVVVEGAAYSFTPDASDPDGDPLTFAIVNKPNWATFNQSSGQVSGTPGAGDLGMDADIAISVTDGEHSDSLPMFDVSVIERREGAIFYAAPLSTSCNPSNPGSGTFEDPWANPYYALLRGGLQAGDTLQLRGGTYQNAYSGFMRDDNAEDRLNSCDDDERSSSGDGKHTVIPLFLAGAPGNEIIIENFPGENVIIDGTNARMASANWQQCGNNTYSTTDFNLGSARTPQIWIDPANPSDPGTRLKWNSSGSCALNPGEFTYSNAQIFIRFPDDSAPSAHDIHLTCQGGDCAANPIHADEGAQYMTVRRNPEGGGFYAKYGYYIGYITNGAHHLTFDGVEWIAGGGRDYGYCVRIHDGSDITIKNGVCRESMGEGLGLYGGLPDVGIQIRNITVENMEVFDNGRGWVDGGGAGNSLGMGIILKNCTGCTVRDSKIYNTYRGAIQVNFSTDGCPSARCLSNDILLERNEIFDFCHLRQGEDANAGQTDCGGITIRHNGTNGEIDGVIVRNNMIHGTYATPFSNDASPAGIYTDGSVGNVLIQNNSLANVPGACINVEPNPQQVTIIGNAMDNCSTGRSGCNGLECALYTNVAQKPVLSSNTYWGANGGTRVIRTRGGSDFNRNQVLVWDPTAIQVDPEFVSSSDLSLSLGSGLIDVQPCNEAPAVDYYQMPRPQGAACDVGAHEQ